MDLDELTAPEPNTGCWLWTGNLDKSGYGRTTINRGPTRMAHRVVYAAAHGNASVTGRDLHHTCRQRSCVNPDHLQPMTHAEHMALHGEREVRHCRDCERRIDERRTLCLECKRVRSAKARANKPADRCPMNHLPTHSWTTSKVCAKCQGVYARRKLTAARDHRKKAA